MKRRRVVLLAVLTLGLLAGAVYWSQRPVGFATPDACLEAYVEALKEGDVAKYQNCLGEPLRSQAKESPASLRAKMATVRSWVLHEPVVEGAVAHVEVDEVSIEVRRVPFRLEYTRGGWRIVGIGPAKEITSPVPPGTHVKDVPE